MRAVFILCGLLLAVLIPLRFGGLLLILCCMIPMIVVRHWAGLIGYLGVGVVIALIWQGDALSRWPPIERAEPILVTGTVVDLPSRQSDQQRFLFRPESMQGLDWRLPRRIRVSVYDDQLRVKAGEKWQLPLKLRRPRGFMNPIGFDYEQWLAAGKIDATAVLSATNQAVRLAPAQGLSAWRSIVSSQIAQQVSYPAGRALLQGLVTGDRRGFTDHTWEILRTTGTGHLLAISGLHIGLMAAFGYGLGRLGWRWARLPGDRRAWSLGVGAALACGYAALAGFSVPTVRALTMLSLGSLAILSRRRLRGIRLLIMAALGLVAIEPSTALMPGAWLSFVAVGLILLLIRGRKLGAMQALWLLQIGLFVGLAPLTALFFGSFSPLAIPINLLVLPLFSLLVVPGALISTGLLWIYEPAGALGLSMLGFLLEKLYQAGGWLVDLGATPIPVSHMSVVVGLLSLVAVALFFLPKGTPMRGLSVVFLLLLVLRPSPNIQSGNATITWLEVGQGNAAVIQTRAHTVVIDTGPVWRSGGHAAAFTLIPYLKERGIKRIDTLIITHADADHRGGISDLAATFDIGQAWVGEPIAALPKAQPCEAGEQWVHDGVMFEFLAPPSPFAAAGNAASCVTSVGSGGEQVLFTGDIADIEEYSIAMRLNSHFAVVEAPHHGSQSSSGSVFLQKTAPHHVVISAGYHNGYSMPNTQVVERLLCAGAVIHDTGLDGAVVFHLKNQQLIPAGGERARRSRILNAPQQVGRFRDGQEILYHRGSTRFLSARTHQRLCKM
ncbi:DNA internalization-related competence protein ComEC/Rec2 [Spiribacter sp. C176]|uniref:DNA internalization-related competence protein ComEC/Rec2 n=1 Tax=Spiribacter salilacus TaxID=2664894 RepID=A0A6N7QSJ3_9GAMM|nr:DNA internalization-related competence protein ComEC/Rec2 [Spiribacter salilacus]MRH77277.1 DNA internalization-related competence protein ComEC/Rec2 [Spiribacter salilacus]